VPVTNHNVSFEIEDAMPAKVAIDGDEPAAADATVLINGLRKLFTGAATDRTVRW
jgi:hypothetical protein